MPGRARERGRKEGRREGERGGGRDPRDVRGFFFFAWWSKPVPTLVVTEGEE